MFGTLRSSDPDVRIKDSVLGFGNMLPGAKTSAAARIAVAPGSPAPSFGRLDLALSCGEGYRYGESLSVSIGRFGFADDMEASEGSWAHAGPVDQWHLSTHRHHSGIASWYCGDEIQHLYGNSMADSLISLPVTIDGAAKLSFWCWYRFPNYGTDGLYVETGDGTAWSTLDFIGSGGALGTLTTGNAWLEYTYDLSRYAAGSSIRVRFRFTSDGSDASEGAYVDDVMIYRDRPDIPLPQGSAVGFSSGWNMVSLPRRTFDSLKTALFPAASSFAFSYDGAYERQDTLRSGAGYWLKFPGDQTVTLTGDPVLLDSVAVKPGWNIIGSISSPVPAGDIVSVPGGMVTSPFWTYEGNYRRADTISPGKGYWVKVGDSGKLVLSGSGFTVSRNRVRIVDSREMPPLPPPEGAVAGTGSPTDYSLGQNYPNPFNPSTTVRYQLPGDSRVSLKVYNVLGQVVAVLVDGTQTAGYRSVEWNASGVASGIYFYEFKAIGTADPAHTFTQVRKMILVR